MHPIRLLKRALRTVVVISLSMPFAAAVGIVMFIAARDGNIQPR